MECILVGDLCHIFFILPSTFKATKEQENNACIIKSLKIKAKIKNLKAKNSVATTN